MPTLHLMDPGPYRDIIFLGEPKALKLCATDLPPDSMGSAATANGREATVIAAIMRHSASTGSGSGSGDPGPGTVFGECGAQAHPAAPAPKLCHPGTHWAASSANRINGRLRACV